MEVYVLVPVRRTFAGIFLGVLMLVLAVLSLLGSCVTIFTLPFVFVFGGLWYLIMFQLNKEFEYSYFDGELRFARVTNKSRRKALGSCTMDDVIQIAPVGDRSVSKYENDNGIKVKDFTSHVKGRPYYDLILQQSGNLTLIKFEPDDKFLDSMEKKYKQKIIRRVKAQEE